MAKIKLHKYFDKQSGEVNEKKSHHFSYPPSKHVVDLRKKAMESKKK